MIVIDASVAVKWFVAESGNMRARSFLRAPEPLIGPDFAIYETLNVLRRKHRRREVTAAQVRQAAGALTGFFDRLVPAATLIERTMELSDHLDHSVYDCAYLACAIQNGARLITADDVFARKAIAKGYSDNLALL